MWCNHGREEYCTFIGSFGLYIGSLVGNGGNLDKRPGSTILDKLSSFRFRKNFNTELLWSDFESLRPIYKLGWKLHTSAKMFFQFPREVHKCSYSSLGT